MSCLPPQSSSQYAAGRFAHAIGFNRNFGIYEDTSNHESNSCKCFGIQPNRMVIRYLHWAFRSSFMAILLSGAFAFYSLTLIFAVFILLIGLHKPHCVHVNGVDFGTTGANFLDAYALSWTTFSTVVSSPRNDYICSRCSDGSQTLVLATLFRAMGSSFQAHPQQHLLTA